MKKEHTKIRKTISDVFDDKGDGVRPDGEIWYRSDLKEFRASLGGEIFTLLDSSGNPGKKVSK